MLRIVALILMITSSKALAGEIELQIKRNNPSLSESYVQELSKLIKKTSKKHEIPAGLFTAILMQESAYNIKAVNRACGLLYNGKKAQGEACVAADIGITQINIKTMKSYGFDAERLQNELSYSLEAGAIVLKWFKDKYAEEEPQTWFCRYNVGTRPFEKVKHNCLKYVRLVNRWI